MPPKLLDVEIKFWLERSGGHFWAIPREDGWDIQFKDPKREDAKEFRR